MTRSRYFWSIFFIAGSTLALEVGMLRFFSVLSWNSFGAMVISIALMGFGISGTLLTIFHDFFHRDRQKKIFFAALLYVASLPIAFLVASYIHFDPNRMLNPSALGGEVLHLTQYFIVFFIPFFFAGLFVGLVFIEHHHEIGKIYFFDLFGAGVGSLSILFVMFILSPFYLVIFVMLLAFTALTLIMMQTELKSSIRIAAFALPVASLAFFLLFVKADYHIYKPISQIRLVEDNRALLKKPEISPAGQIEVFSNLTEKSNLPLSRQFADLVPDGVLPDIYPGIYVDGNRVDGLYVTNKDNRFVHYSLYNPPYDIHANPSVLIVGAGGGFNVFKAYELGAKHVTVVESNPFLIDLLKNKFANKNNNLFNRKDLDIIINDGRTLLFRTAKKYDIIEISDFAISSRTAENYLVTREAFSDYYNALTPGGVITVSIDITEHFHYLLRLLSTVKSFIDKEHLNGDTQVIVLKSLFKSMVMIKKGAYTKDEIAKVVKYCNDLAFDAIYFPGITGKETIYNISQQVPMYPGEDETDMSIDTPKVMGDDQLFVLVKGILHGDRALKGTLFDYSPVTDDKPYHFSMIQLSRLKDILASYGLGGIPYKEIASLINFSNLANVLFFALLIIFIPVVAQVITRKNRSIHLSPVFYVKSGLYFSALGIGFLFIEMVLIQYLTLFLGEVVYSFSIVLSGILLYTGIGSYLSSSRTKEAAFTIRLASLFVVVGILFIVFLLPVLIRLFASQPFVVRVLLALVFASPVAVPLGFFFPLGLSQLTGDRKKFVPWAWGINGATSVISTVLAKLLSHQYGFTPVLAIAALLYLSAAVTFPAFHHEESLPEEI